MTEKFTMKTQFSLDKTESFKHLKRFPQFPFDSDIILSSFNHNRLRVVIEAKMNEIKVQIKTNFISFIKWKFIAKKAKG